MARNLKAFILSCGFLGFFLSAAPASAQISQTNASGVYGAPYRNNVAFDPIHEVYLVIVQRPPVIGRFLNKDGVQIGSDFRIALEPNDPFTAWVSVGFGGPPNDPTFLVTYTIADLNLNPKFGRFVRYVPGGAPAVGPANFITNVGSEWLFSEKASNVWNGQKFVVGSRVIQPGGTLPTPQVNLLDLNGAVSGPVYLGDGGDYYGSPAISCISGGTCLTVGFKAGVATGYSGGTYGRLFDGATLTPQTGLLSLESGRPNEDHGVVYVAHTGRFLAEWFRGGGDGFIDTRLIAPDGSMSAIEYSRAIGPGAGGNSIAYNPRTRTSLLTTKAGAADLVVYELGDDGYPVNPGNRLLITPWDWQVLDYLPSIAADPNNARWLVSYELQAGGLGKIIQGTPLGGAAPPPTCSYGLSPAAAVFGPGGGSGSLSVTAGASCSWSAVPGAGWIHTSASGTGNGTVGFTVDANPGAARSSSIVVGGQIFAVSQSAFSVTSVPAQLVSPASGSALPSSMVTFQWTGGTGVTQYALHVGSGFAGNDLFDSGAVTNLAWTVAGLPTDGRTVYVRLHSLINGSWQWTDYTFTAAAQKAELVSPAPSSTLTSSTVTFQWTGGAGASQYALHVGNAFAGNDLFDSGAVRSLTAVVGSLPADGRTLYVRLHSLINGSWQWNDYRLTATTPVNAKAQLVSPAPSSTLTSSAVTFQWTGGTGVSQYALHVGTALGGNNLFDSGAMPNLAWTVVGLPTDGRTLYVRLHSLINGSWQWNDYAFTATAPVAPPVGAKAQLASPAPSSTLTSSAVTFQWTGGTGVAQYELYVGNGFAGNDLFDSGVITNLAWTVTGLPTDGRTLYVRLHSLINGSWQWTDYTLTAFSPGGGRAQLVSPAPSSTLTSSAVTFQWTGGTGVAQYALHVGSAFAGNDLFDSGAVTNLAWTVAGLPTDGRTLYVRLHSLINGSWQWNDYTFRATTPTSQKAQLVSPAPSSTLTSSLVTFQWTGGTGVTQYALHIGSGFAGNDLFDSGAVTNLAWTVPGLPADGRTLYVRLHSLINGNWQWTDYTFTATGSTTQKGQLVSPAPGSTLRSTAARFEWTGGIGVTRFWLEIGTTPGGHEIISRDMGWQQSFDVTGLPNDGRTIYVQLLSFINGGWQANTYTLTAASGADSDVIAFADASYSTPVNPDGRSAARLTIHAFNALRGERRNLMYSKD